MNQGALYSFKNCDMKKLLSNVSTSAGMAWNNNGNMFFYTDCSEYRVERYCFNSDTCDLGVNTTHFLIIILTRISHIHEKILNKKIVKGYNRNVHFIFRKRLRLI